MKCSINVYNISNCFKLLRIGGEKMNDISSDVDFP